MKKDRDRKRKVDYELLTLETLVFLISSIGIYCCYSGIESLTCSVIVMLFIVNVVLLNK